MLFIYFRSVHSVCLWDDKGPNKVHAALQEDILDFIKQAQTVSTCTCANSVHYSVVVGARVLASILKMPVRKSNSKVSSCLDLPTDLFIPTTFKRLLSQKGNLHISHVLENGLLGKYLFITHEIA